MLLAASCTFCCKIILKTYIVFKHMLESSKKKFVLFDLDFHFLSRITIFRERQNWRLQLKRGLNLKNQDE